MAQRLINLKMGTRKAFGKFARTQRAEAAIKIQSRRN